ncbi:hypothetical protein ACQPW1_27985 [Nocardia sp. CA-128927]|uniref:hypothetical protein n=1 Tax=Nocardia sp. CA-128927 TaxID=3239975 RepID=UPI003D97A1A3
MSYPYGPQGYGQPGYPPPGHGYPPPLPPSASGATAIIGGVLAVLCGGQNVLAAAAWASLDPGRLGVTPGKLQFSAIAAGFIAFLLVVGGIVLMCRLTAGRVMVFVGGALALLNLIISSALFGVFSPLSVVGVVLVLATLTLAAVPNTGRWIAARRQQNQAQFPPGPPYQPGPPYGQPAPPYGQPANPNGQGQPPYRPY